MKSSKNNNFQTLKWIYNCSKKYLPSVALVTFFSSIIALSGILLTFVSRSVIDIATGEMTGNFKLYVFFLFGLVILQVGLNSFDVVLKAYSNGKLTIAVRNHLFSRVTKRKYQELSNYHSGDILNRFTSDVDVMVSGILNILPSVASMLTKIIGGMWALIVLEPKIAVIVVGLGLIVPALGRIVNRKFKELHKKCQESEGVSRSFMQECFENMVVVKTFESEAPITKKLNQFFKVNFKLKLKRSVISMLTHMGMYSFFTFGYYLVLLWGATQISKDILTYGVLMQLLQLFNQLRAPLQNISGIIPQYYSVIASAERLMELEDGDTDLEAVDADTLVDIKKNFKTIEVKDITFGYKDEIILKNCSFSAKRGEITAITGESGSGKSTVFKLLLGLYETHSGVMTIDNDRVIDTSLRGLFAYVPQGNLLLSGTIRENITLCNESIKDEDIIKAAKAAEIYDIIEGMPKGFETMLSERGAGLSEGQIQRISLARALLTDAPILLLDEATSALDEATETRVLNNIREFSDKTILFVTHRNTSLKVCDKIIRVEDKKFNIIKE